MDLLYFDHAATTPVKQEVLNEMLPFFSTNFGNASSMYSIGRRSKKALDNARARVAKAIGCTDKEIYFTSCGSESDNLAIKGVAFANSEKGKHIITSKIEHPAVLNTCKTLEKDGFEVTYLNVDENGFIDLQELKDSIREDTILITIMFANNEIGTIQPIKEIAEIAKNANVIFHTDCVQAVGNVRINVEEIGIDLLSMSAHKFYGPKGVGALYVRSGVEFNKIQDGGHQERDKRAGTENVAGIVGLGKAIELADYNLENYNSKLLKLRNYFIREITTKYENVKINGDLKQRLPGNINVSFPGIDSEELLLKLDGYGICASAGSACSSGSSEPSHVLTAIGLDRNYIGGSLRFTFGEQNTIDDVRFLIQIINKIIV
jgi:cysteine desulfurase